MKLIIDAGNTKTAWATVTTGKQTEFLVTRGISPYFETADSIMAIALEAVGHICPEEPESVHYFGSGCVKQEMKDQVRMALEKVAPHASISVEDDLTGAGIALFGKGEGIACISGTGSNAGYIQNGKMVRRAVSLGYLLGDEGSGAHIGFGFLKKLLSGQLNPNLTENFYQRYPLPDGDPLRRLYGADKPQTLAASLIPFIAEFQHYAEIRDLVQHSFDEMMENMVIPVISEDKTLPVGFVGSVPKQFSTIVEATMEKYHLGKVIILPDPIKALALFFSENDEFRG
jgi:glucosamine kinase